jgi:hypothetical protein
MKGRTLGLAAAVGFAYGLRRTPTSSTEPSAGQTPSKLGRVLEGRLGHRRAKQLVKGIGDDVGAVIAERRAAHVRQPKARRAHDAPRRAESCADIRVPGR